jgi:8-oxo-dGTP pyrophosphatase MutT (NUDIX family)
MERHFTVSGFLVEADGAALHWHVKSQLWLPAGGHIERDEDPIQAVVREVLEETGIEARVIAPPHPYSYDVPQRLPPPMLIQVYDISFDGPHQHIDLIYALRPVTPGSPLNEEFRWVSEEELRLKAPVSLASCGVDVPIPEDVRLLALEAIRIVREFS